MNHQLYILLGDVISSKKIKDRTKFQSKLLTACSTVNKRYPHDLFANFKIIKGTDEIGAVITDPGNLYDIILDISQIIGYWQMRYVMVKGEIDTGLDQPDVSRMDGPAFHKASKLMQELKKDKLIIKISTTDEPFDTLATHTINLIYLIKKKWSPKKIEIIREYEKTRDQKQVAEKLNINQQDVSYHLKTANWKEINKIEQDLKKIIKNKYKKAIVT